MPVWRGLQISRCGEPPHLSECGRTRPTEHETVVQPRHPLRVDVAWRREPGQARDRIHENLPLNARRHTGIRLHQTVVVRTHHHPIGQGSLSARPPRLVVMRLTRRRRGVTARKSTPLIPQNQRSTNGPGEEPVTAPHIQHLRHPAQHRRNHHGVTRQTPNFTRRESFPTTRNSSSTKTCRKGAQRQCDQHLRPVPTHRRKLPRCGHDGTPPHQRIGTPGRPIRHLTGQVVRRSRRHQSVQLGQEQHSISHRQLTAHQHRSVVIRHHHQ